MSVTPIGNHIRRLRFEHDEMTQAKLAAEVGITRQTVIALEAGQYAPSLELAFRIARIFHKGVDEVFFWQEAVKETRPLKGTRLMRIKHA